MARTHGAVALKCMLWRPVRKAFLDPLGEQTWALCFNKPLGSRVTDTGT